MAKRFFDTNMFNDDWIISLSKDGKLFFMYYIATCDHAGIFKLNKKSCEFQTGIKNIDSVIEELGNSLVTVRQGLFFMPRFIKFQYPDFPKSKVRQQDSAINILKFHGLWDEENNSYLTLSQVLDETYVNVSDNVNTNPTVLKKRKKISFEESEFFNQGKFVESMPKEWNKEKLRYYYDAAVRYSKEGNKYIEWDTAVKAWARKDELQGKLKFTSIDPVGKSTFNPMPPL